MNHSNKLAASVLAAAILALSATHALAQRSGDQVLGETATGAAKGAVMGAVADDAWAGAAAGAVGGVLFGEIRRSR